MNYIDLHVHSNASDGTYSPAELVEYAVKKNLAAFALTDHDTIDGLPEAFEAASHYSLKVIPGIELSTEYLGKDIHVLGLNIDYTNSFFLSQLKQFQDSRDLRNEKMCKKLSEFGFSLTLSEMQMAFGNAILTRAHFARILFEKGYIRDMSIAFERYIGDGCPCFIPREKVTPVQAVQLIKAAKGIPVLAHPLLYSLSSEQLQILTEELITAGLIGIEAIYSNHSPMEESSMRRFARLNGLKLSGGSDFHGANKPHIDLGVGRGNLKIPYSIWESLY